MVDRTFYRINSCDLHPMDIPDRPISTWSYIKSSIMFSINSNDQNFKLNSLELTISY